MPKLSSEFMPLGGSDETQPLKKRAKRADAQANRTKLLNVAQQLFTEKGIASVSMMAIAEAAGVGQGTLYRAFANKGDLCVALLDEDLRIFQEKVLAIMRNNRTESGLSQLSQFLHQLVYFLDGHVVLMCEAQNYKTLNNELNHTGLHTWFYDTVGRLLREAANQGEIRSDIEVTYLTDVVLALLNPNLFLYQRQILGLSLEQLNESMQAVLLNGITTQTKS